MSIAVSTLDARYAAARLNSKSAGPSDLVLHRSGPCWWVVGFGSGRFRSYPMTATVTKFTACGKVRYYAKLTIAYPGARPTGFAKCDVHALSW